MIYTYYISSFLSSSSYSAVRKHRTCSSQISFFFAVVVAEIHSWNVDRYNKYIRTFFFLFSTVFFSVGSFGHENTRPWKKKQKRKSSVRFCRNDNGFYEMHRLRDDSHIQHRSIPAERQSKKKKKQNKHFLYFDVWQNTKIVLVVCANDGRRRTIENIENTRISFTIAKLF